MYNDPQPGKTHTVYLEVNPGAFERVHAPSFLAYLRDSTDIIGKYDNGDRGHHDGKLWFDDVVVPPGMFISVEQSTKAYGIQEYDGLDPNISGGTDYLIIFRIHMRGNAPDDGYVRIYLHNANIAPYAPQGILQDKNGHLMAVEKAYVAGQELGVLEVMGIINAKSLVYFTCHVLDSFDSDAIELTDRTEGATGLVIQALTSESKSGMGLLQFESDTGQNVQFSSHYLGSDRMSLGTIKTVPAPPVVLTAGTNSSMIDGWRLINMFGLRVGTVDDHILIQDDGTHQLDFNFGCIFNAEETYMLRGKMVDVSVTLVDKDAGFIVALAKWTGLPDDYTREIFASRSNDQLVFQTGWSIVATMFISEDVVVGDHTQAKTFTVPPDANNYAFIIYPAAVARPTTLKLKEFSGSVNPAFIGYVLQASELDGETHLAYSEKYKEFVQDRQIFDSLRYTIDATEKPMPCGMIKKGDADIVVDPTVNVVPGSDAKGGEGALKFVRDGAASISTTLNVWNETDTDNTVEFWWAEVQSDDTTYLQIPRSLVSFKVKANSTNGGTLVTMPTFIYEADINSRIALRAKANIDDGAFIECIDNNKPLVRTVVDFNELVNIPSTGVNMSVFTRLPTRRNVGVYEFKNSDKVTIPITLPAGTTLAILGMHSKDITGVVKPIKNADYKYDAGVLSFSFPAKTDGQIIVEVYQ